MALENIEQLCNLISVFVSTTESSPEAQSAPVGVCLVAEKKKKKDFSKIL